MGAVLIEFFKMIGKITLWALIALLILAVIITITMTIKSKSNKNRIVIVDCKSLEEIKKPDSGFYLYRVDNEYYKFNGSVFFKVKLFKTR